jgi:uncharacterized membrane protein
MEAALNAALGAIERSDSRSEVLASMTPIERARFLQIEKEVKEANEQWWRERSADAARFLKHLGAQLGIAVLVGIVSPEIVDPVRSMLGLGKQSGGA